MQWAEEGERSTAFFLRQEKVQGQQNLINSIRRSDGTVVHDSKDIRAVWRDYYFRLFTSQDLVEEDQSVFLDNLERKLTPEESELCEGDLTEEECKRALHQMASKKSPGVDGLPAEFYIRFWNLLGPDLVNVFNSSYRQGRLPLSQRSGAIKLLFKKGDILDTANWRPITLLCADYKIAAKALSNRLLRVISRVVSPDQTCGIPGRFMGENLRLLHDVVEYAESTTTPGALLSLDQEKAFDRVEWSFMAKVLTRLGFGESFRRWIKLLYTRVFSAVLVNGFLTEFFPIGRGVRQGCPLSPLLYVLVAESLACAIRADPKIDGFPLPGGNKRVKVSQYADDTTAFVMSDCSIMALFRLFEKYESGTGARLNKTKCHGLLLGPWRLRTSFPVRIRWSSSHIEALGSRLSHDGRQDWGPAFKKLEQILSSWQHRNLSFRGRALIANCLGLSRFWYLGSTVPVDSEFTRKLNSIVFPFVWNKPREWLSRSSVTQHPLCGGLGVVEVSRKLSSLRVMWVKRFLVGDVHPWQYFFRYWLRQAFLAEPVERAFSLSDIGSSTIRRLPPFYRLVMQDWIRLGGTKLSNRWILPRPSGDPLALSDLSSRAAYQLLCTSESLPHKCEAKFRDLDVDWPSVWSNLILLKYDRPIVDTNWLLSHGILPSSDRLIRFGMVVRQRCHCGSVESQRHLFLACHLSISLMSWVSQLISRHVGRPRPLSDREKLFGFRVADKMPVGFDVLLAIVRHYIWVARNASHFDGIQPDPQDLLEKISSTFKFLSRVQRRHCLISTYEDDWLAGGVLTFLT